MKLSINIMLTHPGFMVFGYSLSGNGIVELTFRNQNMFASIATMSGCYYNMWVIRIKDIPIWVFHGAKDIRIEVKEADDIVEEYKKFGIL